MKYLRIYTDDTGETHFEDVEPATTPAKSPVSSAQALLSETFPAESVLFRRVLIDHPSDQPHNTPRRQFVVHLAGEAEIEVSDGGTRRVGPGDVVLVEDTHGKGHTTRRLGDTERDTLFIALPDPKLSLLTGVWRLISWEAHRADGSITFPFGEEPAGMLIYTADGYMSGGLMRPERRPFAVPRQHAVDLGAGEESELAEAFNSFLAYGGRWEFGDDGLVRHHVEYASIPGWTGTTLQREVDVNGDKLILRTPPRVVDDMVQHGVLKWERTA